MTIEKRGVLHIKTMGGLVDGRRVRTSSAALLELSMLEMEKQRLMKEVSRAERRSVEIRGLLTEIEAKQVRLQQFVDRPAGGVQPNQALAAASPLPIHSVPKDGVRRRALAY